MCQTIYPKDGGPFLLQLPHPSLEKPHSCWSLKKNSLDNIVNPFRTIRPPCGFCNYICRKFDMLTSLTTCKHERDPRWFFVLNPLVQSNREMIKCAIFGEFFENWEGIVGCHFTSSYLFFYNSKLFEKNYTSISWWYVLVEKNQSFWSTQHSDFNIPISVYVQSTM